MTCMEVHLYDKKLDEINVFLTLPFAHFSIFLLQRLGLSRIFFYDQSLFLAKQHPIKIERGFQRNMHTPDRT